MKKWIILSISILIILSSVIVPVEISFERDNIFVCNEAQAVVGKLLTKTGKKAAIKSVTFVVERKMKETVKELAKHEVKKPPKTFIPSSGRIPGKTIRKRLIKRENEKYQWLDESKLEKNKDKITKAIEKKVEEKIMMPEPKSFWAKVVDWFTDYRFIVGGGAFLIGYVTGKDMLDIDEIVYEVLEQFGILTTASPLDGNTGRVSDKYGDIYEFGEITEDRTEFDLYELYYDVPSKRMPKDDIWIDEYYRESQYYANHFGEGQTLEGDMVVLEMHNHIDKPIRQYDVQLKDEGYIGYNFGFLEGEIYGYPQYDYVFYSQTILSNSWLQIYPSDMIVYHNGNLVSEVEFNDEIRWFVFDISPYLNMLRKVQRIKATPIIISGDYLFYIVEFSSPNNDLRFVVIHENEEDYDLTALKNAKYYRFSWLAEYKEKFEDGMLAKQRYHFRIMDSDLNFEFAQKREKYSQKAENGELDETIDDNTLKIKLPSITNIPIIDKRTKQKVYIRIKEDGTIEFIRADGSVISEDDIEFENIPGGLDDTEPQIPSYENPDGETPPQITPKTPDEMIEIEPESPPNSGGGTGGGTPTDPTTPTTPTTPNTPKPENGDCDKEYDGEKWLKIVDNLTNKFPFSIPFDIGRAIDAFFGGMGSEKPSFEIPLFYEGKTVKIEIPNFIDEWIQVARTLMVFMFDIYIIYALRKFWGGQE